MGKPSSRSELSRAELKHRKKEDFYAHVKATVSALNAQKSITKKKLRSRQKKLTAYDLSSLTKFLPELKEPKQPTADEFKLNCKSRKNLILKEGKQLCKVLKNPAFQADPLAAICQHLENTQPAVEEKPKKKMGNKNGSKKRKEKKLKASAGPQSMET